MICLEVFIPIFGLIINVAIQIIGFRYILNFGLLKSIFLGFFTGFLFLFFFEFRIFFNSGNAIKNFLSVFTVNFITYSSLGYCYFHFINLGETARRVRILRELHNSKEGLSLKEILERYNAKEIIEKRINRLLVNNQIIEKNERYYICNPFMLLIVKSMKLMKLIIFGN